MKIAFVWYFDKASSIFNNWRDGLRAAIEIIQKDHDVDWYLDKQLPVPGDHDFLLFWSSSQEDYFSKLMDYPCEKGLCLTTNPHNPDNLRHMNAIYCESDVVYEQVRALGLRAIKAFGTDTDFFTPDKTTKKDIEIFYPATFSPWKRQDEIAHYGNQLTCIGTVQPDGHAQYEACKKAGVNIKVGYFKVEDILEHYQRAKKVIIPAVHGSERTVLEAMSCDILPEVLHPVENPKTYSFIDEFKKSGLKSPRKFVVKNYSHEIYAKNLLKGME